MANRGQWKRYLRLDRNGPFALLLASSAGCLSFVHPIAPPSAELLAPSAAVPAECRRHVHVYLVHGMDPLDLANLNGVRKWIQSLGYPHVHYGQLYHVAEFKQSIQRVHKEDPAARFVLMGFSLGANRARDLANAAGQDHIPIDLLVYTGGNTLENTSADQPANVLRIGNILASGCIWNGAQMDRADNIRCDDVWHFGSPSHKRTLDYLARELAVVAQRVQPGTAQPEGVEAGMPSTGSPAQLLARPREPSR